ncbi:hypothetical protein ACR3K2_11220 [Cryptosporidium serpentis]
MIGELFHDVDSRNIEIKDKENFHLESDSLFEGDGWDDGISIYQLEPEELIKYPSHKLLWNDNIEKSCGECHNLFSNQDFSKMIICESFCRRPFHLKCVNLCNIPEYKWKCSYCKTNQVWCNSCNEYGNSNCEGFIKCCHPLCAKYFHTKCIFEYSLNNISNKFVWVLEKVSAVSECYPFTYSDIRKPQIGGILEKLPFRDFEKVESLEFSYKLRKIYRFKFICPSHFCFVCYEVDYLLKKRTKRGGNINKRLTLPKLEEPDSLYNCIRCCSSFHENCLHPDSKKITENACICYLHIHEEVINNNKNSCSFSSINFKDINLELKGKDVFKCKSKYLKTTNLILNMTKYVNSPLFKIRAHPYSLPGQCEDWLTFDIDEILNKHSGYKSIRKNVYMNSLKNSAKSSQFLISEKDISLNKCLCNGTCLPETCQNAATFMECNNSICGLEKSKQKEFCKNRPFSKKVILNSTIIENTLKIASAGDKGLGVFATRLIPEKSFIIEYIGEVFLADDFVSRSEEYKRRELQVNTSAVLNNRNKLNEPVQSLNIKQKHWYCMEIRAGLIVDSTYKGNISRLINHSCDPNCVAQKWIVGKQYRVGIFALRDIEPNEELTYNYSFAAYDIGFQCKCNSSKCRGRIKIDKTRIPRELTQKRNKLCNIDSNCPLTSFQALHKYLFETSLSNRELLNNLEDSHNHTCTQVSRESLQGNLLEFSKMINNRMKLMATNHELLDKYHNELQSYLLKDLPLEPFDFSYPNILYGYSLLLHYDGPRIFEDWYVKKSKAMTCMKKPWAILPFSVNRNEDFLFSMKKLYLPSQIENSKKFFCRRLSVQVDRHTCMKLDDYNSYSIFWYLLDNGIGDDDCCSICNLPGELVICDWCHNSTHKQCMNYDNKSLNTKPKRSRSPFSRYELN